jgi:glycosyltransferase involved in cell wall biosynthesis
MMNMQRWIVYQIGAREHYALPRILHDYDLLEELVTDAWVQPGSGFDWIPGRMGARLRGRFDEALSKASISHFTVSLILSELANHLLPGRNYWTRMVRRNRWFQHQAVRHFRTGTRKPGDAPIIFAYAYAARDIFRAARALDATKILGQIDGGPADERLITSVGLKYADIVSPPPRAPNDYWAAWREECSLADRIVVNSRWSRDLLMDAGIEQGKLRIVPVIYERRTSAGPVRRDYPRSFVWSRPLRVLFLGALTIRKGVLETLQAAENMRGEPVEFWFVGEDPHNLRLLASSLPNVRWNAAVPREEVPRFYCDADVFLFPTHSDGFGVTQLEAQDYSLPIIASPYCGDVVEHGRNGLVLDLVSAHAIIEALQYLLRHPQEMAKMSTRSSDVLQRFTGRNVLPLLLETAGSNRNRG